MALRQWYNMIFEIKGQLRGGKNMMGVNTRTGLHYAKPLFIKWRQGILSMLLPQWYKQRKERLKVASILSVHYWPGDLRKRDISALLDGLFHCLEKVGAIEDDGLIRNVHWIEESLDRENPRALLILKPK